MLRRGICLALCLVLGGPALAGEYPQEEPAGEVVEPPTPPTWRARRAAAGFGLGTALVLHGGSAIVGGALLTAAATPSVRDPVPWVLVQPAVFIQVPVATVATAVLVPSVLAHRRLAAAHGRTVPLGLLVAGASVQGLAVTAALLPLVAPVPYEVFGAVLPLQLAASGLLFAAGVQAAVRTPRVAPDTQAPPTVAARQREAAVSLVAGAALQIAVPVTWGILAFGLNGLPFYKSVGPLMFSMVQLPATALGGALMTPALCSMGGSPWLVAAWSLQGAVVALAGLSFLDTSAEGGWMFAANSLELGLQAGASLLFAIAAIDGLRRLPRGARPQVSLAPWADQHGGGLVLGGAF